MKNIVCLMNKFFNSRDGSVSIEAAIITPMLVFTLMVGTLSLYGSSAMFYWHTAMHKTAQEQQLNLVAFNNAANLSGLAAQVNKYWQKVPNSWRGGVLNSLGTGLSSSYFAGKVNAWYKSTVSNSYLLDKMVQNRHIKVLIDQKNNLLWLDSSYSINLGLGKISGRDKVAVPLWYGVKFGQSDDDKQNLSDEADNFWQWHNFKRGRYLREKFGGNLPLNYPVLSGYSSGKATVIKSMDLTAPTWQDTDKLEQAVSAWLQGLNNFKGNIKPWGKDKVQIKGGDIQHRHIIVVIPDNSSAKLVSTLESSLQTGQKYGITYDIIKDKTSYRFENQPQP